MSMNIDQLKSHPERIRSTPLEAADALATILGTRAEGAPAPGTLGHYQVRREVARGGMGIVLEAFDPELGRRPEIVLITKADLPGAAEVRDNLAAELEREVLEAKREARAAFGKDEVYLEKLVERARHHRNRQGLRRATAAGHFGNLRRVNLPLVTSGRGRGSPRR